MQFLYDLVYNFCSWYKYGNNNKIDIVHKNPEYLSYLTDDFVDTYGREIQCPITLYYSFRENPEMHIEDGHSIIMDENLCRHTIPVCVSRNLRRYYLVSTYEKSIKFYVSGENYISKSGEIFHIKDTLIVNNFPYTDVFYFADPGLYNDSNTVVN